METPSPAWQVFASDELVKQQLDSDDPYLEFLEVPSLSCGIYSLPAGAEDLQTPHAEDEVYSVLSGRARLRVDGEERMVGPGSILYVAAAAEHSFVEIEETLTLLVFFASERAPGN